MARQTVEQRIAALEQQVQQLTRIAQSQQVTINALRGGQGRIGAVRQNASSKRPATRRSSSAVDFESDPLGATFDAALDRQRILRGD